MMTGKLQEAWLFSHVWLITCHLDPAQTIWLTIMLGYRVPSSPSHEPGTQPFFTWPVPFCLLGAWFFRREGHSFLGRIQAGPPLQKLVAKRARSPLSVWHRNNFYQPKGRTESHFEKNRPCRFSPTRNCGILCGSSFKLKQNKVPSKNHIYAVCNDIYI